GISGSEGTACIEELSSGGLEVDPGWLSRRLTGVGGVKQKYWLMDLGITRTKLSNLLTLDL
ncbi:MAG TPA: hypothetical protein VF427_08045, partial [Noviherbaspirillum sp.]